VSEQRIAKALNVDVSQIRKKVNGLVPKSETTS